MAANPLTQQAFQFFTSKGYSPTVSAALVGNMMQESQLKPTALNQSEGAYGINQWLGDRRMNYENYATKQGTSLEDFVTQLGFTDYELNNSEKKAGDALRSYQGTDVAEATQLVSDKYLRPGDPRMDNRIKYAQSVLEQAGVDTTGWSPQMVEGALSQVEAQGGNPQEGGILSSQLAPPTEAVGPVAGNAQEVDSAPDERSFWKRADDWLKRPAEGGRPATSDALLAIGTGLLSGNNWAEGGAAAGKNLMAVRQQAREDELRNQAVAARGAAGGPKFKQAGNLILPNGKTVIGRFNETSGQYEDMNGRVLADAKLINRSNLEGFQSVPNAKLLSEKRKELHGTELTLNSLDRVIGRYDNMDQGLGVVANTLGSWYNTLTEQGLTPEQINQAVQKGELQGLIGKNREAIVGGGVMTEQDALRVLSALGGDISVLQNPQVAQQLLTQLYTDNKFLYEQGTREWNWWSENYPTLRLDKWKSSTPSGGPVKPAPGKGALTTEAAPPADAPVEELFQFYSQ